MAAESRKGTASTKVCCMQKRVASVMKPVRHGMSTIDAVRTTLVIDLSNSCRRAQLVASLAAALKELCAFKEQRHEEMVKHTSFSASACVINNLSTRQCPFTGCAALGLDGRS
eukprot:329860-Amphidinium_carterae.1